MKFGLFHEFPCHGELGQSEVFEESFALVDQAENLGVDAVWLAEYHFLPQRSVWPANLATALELISSHRVQVGDMITHRLGLEDAGLGFKLTAEAQSSLKVIVEPQR